ncbi:sigma-70 family RNA polymerase sigma factor [Bacillus sp. CGMCC 1.16607]|uniref:sigma-70 family RNA polymerase sigma factor n=1 Tax=Bacillus sp. CGMCC 1.16607 TaxID=3351842 RepID=UPI003633211C
MRVTNDNVVQQIKLKNEKTISYLMKTHGGLIHAVIRRYLNGNQQDIEECFSDVLVSIWFHIDSFDSSKNEFKQWIVAIAKYRAIDYVRKSIKLKQHISNKELDDRILSPLSSESLELSSLFKELTDTERTIFKKYYVEGVTSKEIANDFQAKESWVHNKLSRVRKKLKTILLKNEV